jgi:hypothetical protein
MTGKHLRLTAREQRVIRLYRELTGEGRREISKLLPLLPRRPPIGEGARASKDSAPEVR